MGNQEAVCVRRVLMMEPVQGKAELPLIAAPIQPVWLQPAGMTGQGKHILSAASWRAQCCKVQVLLPAFMESLGFKKTTMIIKSNCQFITMPTKTCPSVSCWLHLPQVKSKI